MNNLKIFRRKLRKAIFTDNRKKLLHIITKNINKEVSLLLAVEYRCTWFVKALLDNGADSNYKDTIVNRSSLHVISMFMGLFQSINILENTDSLEHLTNYNYAPLRENFEEDSFNIADILLSHGADINSRDRFSKSPLHVAVESNNIGMVKFLISKGADINVTDIGGKTPLHYCTRYINMSIVKELLSKGADTYIKEYKGYSVLYYSIIYSYEAEPARSLLEAGADPNSEYRKRSMLQIATSLKRIKAMKLLIEYGADINHKDINGCSPLHYSVLNFSIEIPETVKILVENGANVNLTNNFSETPIFKTLKPKVVKYLIDNGADINVVNISNNTLLSSLYTPTSDYILPIISKFTLLKHYSDDNVKYQTGYLINYITIMNSSHMSNIKNKCEKEIFRLKNIKLHSEYTAEIFLYSKNIDLLARFVNHKSVLNLPTQFTIYKGTIEKSIELTRERTRILNAAMKSMDEIDFFRYLPHHVKSSILSNLDNDKLLKISK